MSRFSRPLSPPHSSRKKYPSLPPLPSRFSLSSISIGSIAWNSFLLALKRDRKLNSDSFCAGERKREWLASKLERFKRILAELEEVSILFFLDGYFCSDISIDCFFIFFYFFPSQHNIVNKYRRINSYIAELLEILNSNILNFKLPNGISKEKRL